MGKNIKILIIEDDSMISMQIENLILSLDYSVSGIAKSSQEAFQLSLEKNFDLIISDININGELDGIETSKILYERHSTPVIFVTAFYDLETLEKASLVEYAGYVIKPFREEELIALINLTVLKYNLPLQKEKLIINQKYSYCCRTEELFFKNNKIELTKREKRLLQLLLNFKNEVIPYKAIEENVWVNDVVLDDARRQLIYRFKKKLSGFPLELQKGIGYRLLVN